MVLKNTKAKIKCKQLFLARVSTERQMEGHSIPAQLAMLNRARYS